MSTTETREAVAPEAYKTLAGLFPAELDAHVSAMSIEERSHAVDQLSALAVWAHEMNAYLTARSACGSDAGHQHAKKLADAARVKARRLAGYTYPRV